MNTQFIARAALRTLALLLCGASPCGMNAASPALASVPPAAARHWTADNGNGTYSNPLFYGEFEDPDMIRVGTDYYLVGTTMHMNPALEILHSKDLVNWELVGYCMDRLDFGPAFRLQDGNIYGRGIWAPCIRHHKGVFYIFSNINGVGLQVFRSKSIRGPWERNQLAGRHDLSVLFDDDLNKIFMISSAGSRGPDGSTTYPIEELAPDLRAFDTSAPKRQMVIPRGKRMGEGHHLYKIDGKYYDISAIPGGPVDQMVARADSIDGPWEVTAMVQGESMGVPDVAPARAQADNRGLWLHQGGMCDTPSGEWWSVIMSDHGSAGRMVSLVPVSWAEGFPLIGLPGNLRKAPNTWIKPDTRSAAEPKPAYVWDEDFDSGKLNPHWQWNHAPDDTKWSLSEKHGVLRLHSLPASNFYNARNSVCQRPPGPECILTVELDRTGMKAGDTAGLGLLSAPYAWIDVVNSDEGPALQMTTGRAPARSPRGSDTTTRTNAPVVSPTPPPSHIWLRVHCNFDTDDAVFSWSADGKQFTALGEPFRMSFQLTTFQGVRPALFHYNTSGQAGGYADFDNYVCEEPRARGVEREIPLGKTITLTSGADGSFLAADTEKSALVNVLEARERAVPPDAKFEVAGLGKGRVALKSANGRFVSVDGEAAVLKDLAGKPPGMAESFQWVNLMRGDTMLMSLANHRYLATKPNEPGRVTVTSSGPSPARKRGECFKWNVVDSPAPSQEAATRIIEDGGTGPYQAVMASDESLATHTIFRPRDLRGIGTKAKLPIVAWGNGACANSPWEHVNFLSEVASHGFLVIAIGPMPMEGQRVAGGSTTSRMMLDAIQWAITRNNDTSCQYYQKLDISKIAVAGMSCGGLQALEVAPDPRISTVMICNSGILPGPGRGPSGMPKLSKDDLAKLHSPTIYILGGEKDIAHNNGMDDFQRVNHVPIFAANLNVGHGGTYSRPHGGEFAKVAAAWLMWQLKEDQRAGSMFIGDPCGLANVEGWKVAKKNIP